MVKRLIWSESSLKDKNDIFEYWNRKNGNKLYSKKLQKEFRSTARILTRFPGLGIKIKGKDMRCCIKNEYMIFYKISHVHTLIVLRIWDSRRNPEDLEIRK